MLNGRTGSPVLTHTSPRVLEPIRLTLDRGYARLTSPIVATGVTPRVRDSLTSRAWETGPCWVSCQTTITKGETK